MKTITIIVPCFNEEAVINILYDEVKKYFVENYQFYLLFVNDGSKDKTLELVKQLEKEDKRVKYVSFSKNFGKEAAMLAGLKTAKLLKSDAAIIIDADMQDPPSLIPSMLESYEQGYKFVYAKHKTRAGEAKLKTFFAMQFYKVYAFLTKDQNLSKGSRDFCLLDKLVIDAFISIKDYKRFTKGIFSWVGFEKKCIEFDYIPRVAGETKWSFRKLFRYAIDGIKQFSNLYLILPKIIIFCMFFFLIADISFGIITHNVAIRNYTYEFLFLVMFIILYYMMKLLYDIREQNRNRPLFLIADSNIEEEGI